MVESQPRFRDAPTESAARDPRRAELEVAVSEALAESASLDARDVEAIVTGTEVTLTGNVQQLDEARRVIETVASVKGVTSIRNALSVGQPHLPKRGL